MASGSRATIPDRALTIAVDGRSLAGGPGRGIAHYLRALLQSWPADDELRIVVPRGAGVRVAEDLAASWAAGGWSWSSTEAAGAAGGPQIASTGAALAGRDARIVSTDAARAVGGPQIASTGLALAGRDARIVVVEHAAAGRLPYALGAVTGRPRLDVVAGGCDVAWVPAPAPVAVGAPFVLTVHDRSWEARPTDFTAYERLWHRVARPRRLARRAARVLTTTRWGRDDLVAAWALDPERVTAVHLAPVVTAMRSSSQRPPDDANAHRRRPGDANEHLSTGAVLFVGALEPRKGPDVLADAIARARPLGFDAPVVVVGAGREDALLRVPGVWPAAAWIARASGQIDPDDGTRRPDGEGIDDEVLAALYAGARAVVVPSRLEGFGLPALEALACGTPVVATDLPAVREVLGDAATFVPPDDPKALADALLDLPAAPATPGPLAGRTWAEVARETRAVLAEAAR